MTRRRRIVILVIFAALALTLGLSALSPGRSPEPRSTVARATTTTASPGSPAVTTAPGPAAPVTTQPATTASDTTAPDTTPPVTTQPATTRPTTTRPTTTQPATTQPATTRPATTLPVLGEPVACVGAPTVDAAAEIAIGLREQDAVFALFVCGWETRVTRRDGADLTVTADFRPNRVNVEVTDGHVTEVLFIG